MKPDMTTPEVAKELNVCMQRVSQLIERKELPAHHCGCGRSFLVNRKDLSRFIESRKDKEKDGRYNKLKKKPR